MTNKLTKEQALLECRKLWLWLARNPSAEKQEWPGWRQYESKYGEANSHCPVCHYIVFSSVDCKECLITWSDKGNCMHPESPYILWFRARSDEPKSKYARQVALLAHQALQELRQEDDKDKELAWDITSYGE